MAQPAGCSSHDSLVQARLEGRAAALVDAANLKQVSKVQQLWDGSDSGVREAAFLEASIAQRSEQGGGKGGAFGVLLEAGCEASGLCIKVADLSSTYHLDMSTFEALDSPIVKGV